MNFKGDVQMEKDTLIVICSAIFIILVITDTIKKIKNTKGK